MKPLTAYAAGKAASDLIFSSYVASLNCKGYTIRPYNNFGPRQAYKSELAGLIPNTILINFFNACYLWGNDPL